MNPVHACAIRAAAVALAAVCLVGAAATTNASSAYDGNWSVMIRSANSECTGSHLPLRIENGAVAYNGYVPVSVSGSVAGDGSVTVRVSGGARSASGSGQLSGNSGSGTWSGSASSTACSGTWTAQRRA
jgi:hypothetical protein